MDLGLIFKIIIVVVAGTVGIASIFVGKYKGQQDNPIEELAEQVIKNESGVDIDLTPLSPEKENDGNK